MSFGTNTQIQFLSGSQANINTLINNKSGVTAGAFYLTEDSHRLYVGMSASEIVPVNDTIVKIDSITDLPDATTASVEGTIYYATNDNILCIYTYNQVSKKHEWVQINPDTNYYVKGNYVGAVAATGSTAGKEVTITNSLWRNDSNTQVNATWKIQSDDTIALAATQTNATGTAGAKDAVITFSCKMALKTVQTATNGNYGTIVLSKDGSSTANDKIAGKITINGDDYVKVTSDASGNINLDGTKLHGADIKSISMGFDGNGVLSVTGKRNENDDTTNLIGTVTPGIKLKSTDTTPIKFVNGTATLGVYTTTEVDNAITNALVGLNPMRYMGLTSKWGTDDCLPALRDKQVFKPNNVALGDTYKVDTENTFTTTGIYHADSQLDNNEKWAKIGDLFIATGTEVEGIITTNFAWDHIPSADDTNSTYEGVSINHGIKIQETTTGGSNSVIAQLDLQAGTDIALTDITETGTDNPRTNTVKIDHGTVTRTATDPNTDLGTQDYAIKQSNRYSQTKEIQYVSGVISSAQGHVTEVQKSTIDLIDTNASMKSVTLDAETVTAGSKIKLTNTTTLSHYNDSDSTSDYAADSLYLQSDNSNLQLAATADTVTMSFVWGTF